MGQAAAPPAPVKAGNVRLRASPPAPGPVVAGIAASLIRPILSFCHPMPSVNRALLLEKLPLVLGWIDRTLADHAAAARPVNSYRFPRLPHYYPPALLAEAHVVSMDQVPVPPLATLGLAGFEDFENLGAAGITYRSTYFVRDDAADDESLHFHELVHVVQWRHLGPERFVLAYALGHLRAGGYDTNPLETMAYDLQSRFEDDPRPFAVEPLVQRQLAALVPTLFAGIPTGS